MELIVGNKHIIPTAIHPVAGGVEAILQGEALLSVLDATFHGAGSIELYGGALDRRPVEVAGIRMHGRQTCVTLRCTGPRLHLA